MSNYKELVTCSAIWYKDCTKLFSILPLNRDLRNPINVKEGLVVLGHRHGDIITNVHNLLGLRTVENGERSVGETVQGFVTNQNRFLDRTEAYELEVSNGRIEDFRQISRQLFSEDLW